MPDDARDAARQWRAKAESDWYAVEILLLALALLSTSLFLYSRYCDVGYVHSGWTAGVAEGCILAGTSWHKDGWVWSNRGAPKTRWIPQLEGAGRILVIPLWIPGTIAIGALIHLQRRERLRRRLGWCPSCDYDLTGNISGTCPECGTPCKVSAESPDKPV